MPVSRAPPQKPLCPAAYRSSAHGACPVSPVSRTAWRARLHSLWGLGASALRALRFPPLCLAPLCVCVKQPVSLPGRVAGLGRRCCLDRRWALFAQEKRRAGLGLMTGKILAGWPRQLYFPAVVLLRLGGRGNRWAASETITPCRLSRGVLLALCRQNTHTPKTMGAAAFSIGWRLLSDFFGCISGSGFLCLFLPVRSLRSSLAGCSGSVPSLVLLIPGQGPCCCSATLFSLPLCLVYHKQGSAVAPVP